MSISLRPVLTERLCLLAVGVKDAELVKTILSFSENIDIHGDTLAGMLSIESRAMFYAHMSHESKGFTDTLEDTNYSSARAYAVWPSKFDDREHCDEICSEGEEALFNHVYGGDSLGNIYDGDGYRFIGRGYLNVTGRYNYERLTELTDIDYIDNPELLEQPEHAWRSSLAFIVQDDNLYAELQMLSIRGTTREINGGLNGFEHRNELWRNCKPILEGVIEGPEYIQNSSISFYNTLLQYYLVLKGADIKIDGHWGRNTQRALGEVLDTTKLQFSESELQEMVNQIPELIEQKT